MSQPVFHLSPTVALVAPVSAWLPLQLCCLWYSSDGGGLEATSATLHSSGSGVGKGREQEHGCLNPIYR